MTAPETPYRLSLRTGVKETLEELARRATAQGIRAQFLQALNEAVEHLGADPAAWGDPRYNLQHGDGISYYALRPPLLFFYAVYVAEHVVWILDVRPAPGSTLDLSAEQP